MPRPSNPLAAVSGAMVIFFGLLMAMMGVAGASAPSEIRWVLVMLALAGGVMVFGGVQMILAWKRAEDEKEEDLRIMHAPDARPAAAIPPPLPVEEEVEAVEEETVDEDGVPVYQGEPAAAVAVAEPAEEDGPPELLAVWTYDPAEWGAYTQDEKRYRGSEALWMVVAITAIGTWIYWDDAGGPWAAFASALTFGLLLGGIQWGIAHVAHQKNVAVPSGDVRITTHGVLLNGTYLVLDDEHIHVERATLARGTPSILEVKVGWKTRNGPASELIRIPVPAGREDEAERVRARLLET